MDDLTDGWEGEFMAAFKHGFMESINESKIIVIS